MDEDELNALGYQLVQAKKLKQAIRVFQLNVEAYPNSGNTYDSLAEGYMDDGDKLQAIANYKRSLQLNPANNNAVKMLQKLNAPCTRERRWCRPWTLVRRSG
jgi:predicted Zn-dependent protease